MDLFGYLNLPHTVVRWFPIGIRFTHSGLIVTFMLVACIACSMARKSLSEIVEACENTEIEAEPSLESENAYRGKDKGELSDENKAAIARIVNGE